MAGLRCFIAAVLEPAPGPALQAWLEELRTYRELSVPPPENLHLTLAFLGQLDAEGVGRAAQAVSSAAGRVGEPWSVEWGAAGAFPSLARPRVLWLGLADTGPTVSAGATLGQELAARQLPVEGRQLRPHVTLARVRSGLRREVEESLGALLKRPPAVPPSRVTGLVLLRSRTARGGSVYEPLAESSL